MQTQDLLERLYLLGGLGTHWCSHGQAGGSGRGEGDLGFAAVPTTRAGISGRRWMDGAKSNVRLVCTQVY